MISFLIFLGVLISMLTIIGLPIFAVIIVIGTFVFVGTPFYAILNAIEKIKNSIKENIREKRIDSVFARYRADEQMIRSTTFTNITT